MPSYYSRLYFDILRSQVNQIKTELNDDKESLSFLRLCCSLIFNIDYTDVDEYLTDGYDDLGADAIYFDINEDTNEFKIGIIQTKYNKTDCERNIFNRETGEEVINKFKNIFDYFFSNSTNTDHINELVIQKKQEYQSLIENSFILTKVDFHVCHLGKDISSQSRSIWKRWLEGNHFRDNIDLINHGLEETYLLFETTRVTTISDYIDFYGKFFEFVALDVKGLITSINANELIRLNEKFENKLFQKNIRYSLGENLINKKIIKSAEDPENRDKFWFLNNGITIVCQKYEKCSAVSENIKLKLTDFQIVNGAQTTSALRQAKKNGSNLNQVNILIKIYQAGNELAEKITDSTNSQNPVSKRDLRSNDDIQRLLEDTIKQNGYFYQRKRNQYVLETDKSRIVDNYDFAQQYYAFCKGYPAEARNKKAQLFDNDEIYNSIFDSSINAERVIFMHRSFQNLLKGLRILRTKYRNGEIQIEKELVDISQRAKYHILYGFKLIFLREGYDINSEEFWKNEDLINKFSDTHEIVSLLKIINNSLNVLLDESGNKIKIFQKSELAQKIKETIDLNS